MQRPYTGLVTTDAPNSTSSEALRIVLSTNPDAVVATDGEDLVCGWNEAAERTFGWTAAEAIGRDLAFLIFPPQRREAHQKGMRLYQETGDAREWV